MPRDLFADEEAPRAPRAPRDLFEDDQNPIHGWIAGMNKENHLGNLLQGALTSLGKGGQAIASTLTGGYAPTVNMDEEFKDVGNGKDDLRSGIMRGIGSYLPYGMAGGGSLIGQAAAGGAHGAATSDPGDRTGGALKEALMNTLIGGGAKALEAIRPSKMFRGNLSPEELKKNLAITQDTETGLGDVIGSPFLKKKLENTLTALPFSGANEALQRTGKIVHERGEKFLDSMLGEHDPENVPATITKALKDQYKIHQTRKNMLYDEFNHYADNSGINLELPSFAKKANDYSDAINETNLLKTEPDLAKIFNKLQNYKNPVKQVTNQGKIVDAEGKPFIDETSYEYPTFKEANLLKGRLRQLATSAKKSPDASMRNMANVFGDLSSSIKQDIEGTLKSEPKVAELYQKAEKNYKDNFSPFLDRDIYKFVSGNADPETIVRKFIQTSPITDLGNKLSSLATKLEPQQRSLLAYSYFSRALDNEGNLNPAKLSTAIRKLGPNQFKALVPDEIMRRSLLNYSKLAQMNQEANSLMFNPKTGQRNADVLASGLLGGLTGSGKLIPTIATLGAGRLATKALTSQKLRENLVKTMIENKPKINTPKNTIGAETLAQALAGQLQGNQ